MIPVKSWGKSDLSVVCATPMSKNWSRARLGMERRDDGRSGSYPRVGYRLPCLCLGSFLCL